MHLQKRLTARLKIYLVNCLILPLRLSYGSRIFYALLLPPEDLGGCAGAFGGV